MRTGNRLVEYVVYYRIAVPDETRTLTKVGQTQARIDEKHHRTSNRPDVELTEVGEQGLRTCHSKENTCEEVIVSSAYED
jgi:hypothetical protein